MPRRSRAGIGSPETDPNGPVPAPTSCWPAGRVRTGRFRRGRADDSERHDMIRRPCHEESMLPSGEALIVNLAQSGVSGADVLSVVDSLLSGSALPDIEASGLFVYTGCPQPPARCSVLWPLLTSRSISSAGSPQVRTRWLPLASLVAAVSGSPSPCGRLPARPPHLPPQLDRSASSCWPAGCQLAASRRPYYAVLVHRPAGLALPLVAPAASGWLFRYAQVP